MTTMPQAWTWKVVASFRDRFPAMQRSSALGRAGNDSAEHSTKVARLAELDFIRGAALLTMAVEHISYLTKLLGRKGSTIPTLDQIYPSTMAEIFFLISGYLFGHVRLYGQASRSAVVRAAFHRASQLFIYNAATFVACAAILSLAAGDLIAASRFAEFKVDPLAYSLRFLTLQEAPYCLDVLQVYIILLLATPAFALLIMKSRVLGLLWVMGSWVGVQVYSILSPPHVYDTIAMNLWAWQALFFAGMLLGSFRLYEAIVSFAVDNKPVLRGVLIVSIVLIAYIFVVRHYDRFGLQKQPALIPGLARATIGPLRIVSFTCLIVTLAWIYRAFPPSTRGVSRAFTALGTRSLSTFTASNLANIPCAIVWSLVPSPASYVAVVALGMAFIFGWVALVNRLSPQKVPAFARSLGSGLNHSQ